MNDSYDIPSEPRLSNTLQLSRPPPQSRTKMKQKQKLPSTPSDTTPIFLGLDDTVPFDDSTIDTHSNIYSTPQLVQNSTPYVNQLYSSNNLIHDDFYVMPRQENLSTCDTYNTLVNSIQNDNSFTPPNLSETTQFYATPPTFTKNFILESNLSFDDSQDVPNISLDSVPDLVNSISTTTTSDSYYSYPTQQVVTTQRQKFVNNNENKDLFKSKLNQVIKQQAAQRQQLSTLIKKDETKNYYSIEPIEDKQPLISPLIHDFVNTSINNDNISIPTGKKTDYLDIVRRNTSNRQCADCDGENPTIAIMSWLLVICKKCAAIHDLLTSDFLRLQSLITTSCDSDLIDLLHDYGNRYSNKLLENNSLGILKPNSISTQIEREQYIRKKYLDKLYLQPLEINNKNIFTQEQLNEMLYENVETSNCGKTLHLIMLGANPNYSQKMFAVADHAKRHQQIRQMKIILANGGLSEFDLMKTNTEDINLPPYERTIHLVTKHGILKELLTRYETDRIKIYSITNTFDKNNQQNIRYLFEIDLNNVLAICNQSVNSVSLKSRSTNIPTININSQCTLIVDEQTSFNEYVWIFPNELERALWIRELLKRQYSYHQLIYSDFILLTKLNVQEGINAEKQQVIAVVYPGRFVICSDTIFDEVDLKKYFSLTYQKSEEFTGVVLCLVSNRFLYLSSPISKLTDMLYSCLREATKVKTLTDLNCQILTSQNVPVIVERFINFIFEHGLESKGIYRQAGHETKVKQLLNELLEDPFTNTLTRENYSEHDVANGLKRFLRQLDTPLLGTRQNYDAWLRSTVDSNITTEQLIQYYRGLLVDLKHNYPINYATLRKMLLHIQTVSMLSNRNAMILSNLVSTFAPCIISQPTLPPPSQSLVNTHTNEPREHRGISFDDLDMKYSKIQEDNISLCDDEIQDSIGTLVNTSTPAKVKRNQSLQSSRSSMISISPPSRFPLSSSYVRVTPSIQADLEIMNNLCKYYRELFDVSNDEIEHEKKCVETLISLRTNQCQPRKLDGTMVSVYFESRADELNGYAINILEQETTANHVIDKLLKQIHKHDCFFWALFEVIIDQNLERPMYSTENISNALNRYRTYLPQELNRQATFVVKLNYVQFEKERLQQQSQHDLSSVECEYFDSISKRWIPCLWIYEKSNLQIHRISNEKFMKWKSRFTNSSTPNTSSRKESILNSSLISSSEQQTQIYSWFVQDLYLYIGADRRIVNPFDMNEYRTLTISHIDSINESTFGIAFRFNDRHQMFAWYLELVRINGHDQWTRQASHTIPDGVNYLPLQNYHAPSTSSISSRKKSEQIKTKLITKSNLVASSFGKQLRK
ncbi:unnamed protein product [Rotaria sordida]|uniref:Uncharacterized protein n=1 Tax=Rotaria sordida TaxID=392033 RepID=A0A813R0V9_9BILA|nr:unnamed protein product [Rotaria sordida]CAF0794151.1 unnamed protein product [Rotaria sordida]CAF0857957.1 unnamed protein product [Rotaria sordida]CAF0904205.1 unnamed protein product [Rotaria sordida]CAF3543046.1 unnamed protein product [Rotaria sordida]